ncbi:Abi-alpha family protein [Caulobacter hibisci]|uniref:Abi-alpha family protein n=1 Tax=Caulobacter hibisci TaxID=2035993 RepID=UPI0018E2B91B|nr:Abi-alpha family protein [Caulobacter hibisci]
MEAPDPDITKVAGQIAADTAKDLRGAFERLFGDAWNELGLSIADRAKLHRFENLVKILRKVERIALAEGYGPEQLKALPFGDAIRITEAASLEEDDDVQEMWARLIAKASAPEGGFPIQKVYIELLKSLSGPEVLLLNLIWSFRTSKFDNREELVAFNEAAEAAAEAGWRKVPSQLQSASIQNLQRLRCIFLPAERLSASGLVAKMPNELIENRFGNWSLVDAKKFDALLTRVSEQLAVIGGSKELSTARRDAQWGYHQSKVQELRYGLTSLGSALMEACNSIDGAVSADHNADED